MEQMFLIDFLCTLIQLTFIIQVLFLTWTVHIDYTTVQRVPASEAQSHL